MRVEAVKMSGDDRYGDGQGQHAGDGARGPDQATPRPHRHFVSVPDRRHGDDRPPERARDRRKLTLLQSTNRSLITRKLCYRKDDRAMRRQK